MTTEDKIDLLLRRFERIEDLAEYLLTKRPTQRELAKQAGCDPRTLARRIKKARLQKMLKLSRT